MIMLRAFFNPYPGRASDYESGKKCLLLTAIACKKITEKLDLKAYDHSGNDSIKCFIIAEDSHGTWYKPSSFIFEYTGRNRELVKWFLRLFDRGARVRSEDIDICDDWVLCGLEVSAPILEYASRQDGIAITITDDKDWKSDFYSFIDISNKLPNIHGQEDCTQLQAWIDTWSKRNLSFKALLESKFNSLFCDGASNSCFPSEHEEDDIIKSLERAKERGYEIDNDLIKHFKSKYGNILELRSYRDGVRLFFVLNDDHLVIGGFYRKSASVNQNKAGEYAALRLREQGYL